MHKKGGGEWYRLRLFELSFGPANEQFVSRSAVCSASRFVRLRPRPARAIGSDFDSLPGVALKEGDAEEPAEDGGRGH